MLTRTFFSRALRWDLAPVIHTRILCQYTVAYTMKGGQMEGLLGLSQLPVLTPVLACATQFSNAAACPSVYTRFGNVAVSTPSVNLFAFCCHVLNLQHQTRPLVSGMLGDAPQLLLPERTHMISVLRPQWCGAVGGSCEDPQLVSDVENLHMDQLFPLNCPRLQQRRLLAYGLCRQKSLQALYDCYTY